MNVSKNQKFRGICASHQAGSLLLKTGYVQIISDDDSNKL
jgi:hypothetical protein